MKINFSVIDSHQPGADAAPAPAMDRRLPQLAVLDLRIASNRVHYLKFILEGYDGMATLSTLDPRQGLVRLRFPVEVKDELLALLGEMAPRLGGIDWPDVVDE